MTRHAPIAVLRGRIAGFIRQESGASLVEFGMVILVFLFLVFAIIDMGRLAHAWAAAQKATQLAARIAAVRPPVCPDVPEVNLRGDAAGTARYGTLCRAAENLCAEPPPEAQRCAGNADNATAREIMEAIRPLLPAGTTVDSLAFRYGFDPDLGFLGGPYVPVVTVALEGVQFSFVSNLGRLIEPVTGNPTGLGADITLPSMSVSVPGEDLALGTAG